MDNLTNENSTLRNQNQNLMTEMSNRQRVLNDLEIKSGSFNENLKSSLWQLSNENSTLRVMIFNQS